MELAHLIAIKTHFEKLDDATKQVWEAELAGKRMPDEIPDKIWEKIYAKKYTNDTKEGIARLQDLRPGDQVWLTNERLYKLAMTAVMKRVDDAKKAGLARSRKEAEDALKTFEGEQGSNVYFATKRMNDQILINIYNHQIWTVKGYQNEMKKWNTVRYCLDTGIIEQVTAEEFGIERAYSVFPDAPDRTRR